MKKILFSALAIIGCANYSLGQSVPSYVPKSGLVGWWPFTGNALDSSGNGNHGTVNAATLTTDRFGNVSKAYHFNGSSFINLKNLPTSGNQDFSIAGWIKTNSAKRNGIICWGQDKPNASTYLFINSAGKLQFDLAYYAGPESPINIADNSWHFIGVTNNSGLIQLYLDGSSTGSAILMSPNISGSNRSIGQNITNGGPNNFIGAIDDIGIWNRTLTKQEITDLYNASTLGITEKTPIKLFSVYPNPTQSTINVNADNKLIGEVYSILDNTGKVVLSGKINSESTVIGLGNLSGGIYMFSVGENMKNTFKVIKK